MTYSLDARSGAAGTPHRGALYVLCTGALLAIVDGTVANLALPNIRGDLGMSAAQLSWVVTAYLLPYGGLLLLAGRLGDLLGHRKVFLAGLATFAAASLLCALAWAPGVLIVARGLQGTGGALMTAPVLALIAMSHPEPRKRERALGTYAMVSAAGGSLGLLLGGAVTALEWRLAFALNAPVGAATAVLAWRLVPARPGIGWGSGADLPGAALLTGGTTCGVYSVSQATVTGWGSWPVLAPASGCVALLTAFGLRQTRTATPLLALGVLRSRQLMTALATLALLSAGMLTYIVLAALAMQEAQGNGPLRVGVALLPMTLLMGALSLHGAAATIARVGVRAGVAGSLLLITAALVWVARMPPDGSYGVDLLPALALFGVGVGVAVPALITLALDGTDSADMGAVSGLVGTAQQLGGALGLAITSTLAASRTDDLRGQGASRASALMSGYHLAWGVGAGLALAAALVALVALRPRAA